MSDRGRGFTVADVASRFRVGPDKVRTWIRSGSFAASTSPPSQTAGRGMS